MLLVDACCRCPVLDEMLVHGDCIYLRAVTALAWSISALAFFGLPATCGGQPAWGACPSSDVTGYTAFGSGGLRLEAPGGALQARGPTLVVYVFSGTDSAYAANLRFFVDEAVQVGRPVAVQGCAFWHVRAGAWFVAHPPQSLHGCPNYQAGDACEYIIVLQQGAGLAQPDPLPALPPNARYLPHPNECYDLGTVGWVLDQQANLSSFAYVAWLNSSVRGPFLPAYLRGKMHWTEPLLSKITDTVKLVSSSVMLKQVLTAPGRPGLPVVGGPAVPALPCVAYAR